MPVKPSTKYLGVLILGLTIGASVSIALPYLGINFRLLPYTENFTIIPSYVSKGTGRAAEIFAQFAHQLHPPCTSKEVHKVLNAAWLKREMIHGIYILGGKIPLRHDDSQPFVIRVYSEDNKSQANIYIGISGGKGTEEEAYAFLTGTGPNELKMTEFALEYPATPCLPRRFEYFSWWQVQGSSW